jgi:hypothetical protein
VLRARLPPKKIPSPFKLFSRRIIVDRCAFSLSIIHSLSKIKSTMGKEFFEFLEEEFQGLTSQVQEALKQESLHASKTITDGDSKDYGSSSDSSVDIPVLFTRCHAIYQQMRAESRQAKTRTPEFRERLTLYSIQLTALLEHYQNSQFEDDDDDDDEPPSASAAPSPHRKELTFTFTIDDEDEGTML